MKRDLKPHWNTLNSGRRVYRSDLEISSTGIFHACYLPALAMITLGQITHLRGPKISLKSIALKHRTANIRISNLILYDEMRSVFTVAQLAASAASSQKREWTRRLQSGSPWSWIMEIMWHISHRATMSVDRKSSSLRGLHSWYRAGASFP